MCDTTRLTWRHNRRRALRRDPASGRCRLVLDNTVAVVNSKGGVGKTSIVANVAATAALGGWRTLAIDLDPQGNLARDLGYRDRSDDGCGLLEAVMTASPVRPLTGVRPGLDVVAGGRH